MLLPTRYIVHVYDTQVQTLLAIKGNLKSSKPADLGVILSTEVKPMNQMCFLASPGLWNYSRPLTLEIVQNRILTEGKVS